ncbi:MAG: UvrD-helicase domain-containing protein, partial [Ruminiclostridium sp.]|nr:UvrD-helicase domain-containing protein [Ruminiclostridium sp.]
MGEVTWTPEQERAITFRGGAAIVSAAAGSGKTAVLVERVKRLILDEKDPVNADAMVISTFTNEAASELKERLAKAIDDEMKKDPGNKRLLEQRLRLEDAHISTISSFCLNILRRSSTLTGLQPGFGVLDESEARLIYNESLNTVMEDFCENGDPAERDRVFDWFAGETDKRITDAVDTLYRFSRSLPDADTFFDDQLSLFRSPVEASKSGSKAADRFFRRSVLGTVHALQELYGKVLTVTAGTPGERYAVQLGAICGEAEKITDENSCTEVYDGFLRDTDMPACPRKSKNYDNSAVRELHELIKPVFARLKLNAGLFARRKSDLAACEPILGTLISLVRKTEAEYSSRKRDKNRVDFNDIELMTLKLLRGGNGVRSEAAEDIAKDIKVIIVDEFQDSNEIQYEIFRLLSDDRKNLFFVGDIKQSIYRFRGADPLVFSRLTKDPDFTVIPLNRNFRSCDQVIDSVNGIFNGTMTEELGDVDYNESCALVRGTAFDTDDDLNRTELITFS